MNPVLQLGVCALLGCVLALWYECLRPLRRRRNWPADLLVFPVMLYLWMLMYLPLCRTDLRTAHLCAFGAGFCIWEATLGKWLQPAFYGIARSIFAFFRRFSHLAEKCFKKLVKFLKFLYAIGAKWVTIERLTCKLHRHSSGGESHEIHRKRKTVSSKH